MCPPAWNSVVPPLLVGIYEKRVYFINFIQVEYDLSYQELKSLFSDDANALHDLKVAEVYKMAGCIIS